MKTISCVKLLLLAAGLATLTSGCATITKGTTENYKIETEPAGATARLSTGESCTTPCTVLKNRKDEFGITLEKDGFHAYEMMVSHRVSGSGAAGVVGNALVGGVIGVGIDIATGAALELTPNPLKVELIPSHAQVPDSGLICSNCKATNPPGLQVCHKCNSDLIEKQQTTPEIQEAAQPKKEQEQV